MSLTRARILDETTRLAAEKGLQAVSMRAVAAQLGVTPMALYRHVPGKQGLIDGMVERLLEQLPVPDPAMAPRERLAALADAMRGLARSQPDLFLTLFQRPAVTEPALRRRDAVRDALAAVGVPAADVGRAERVLSTFVLGFAASEACGRFGGRDAAAIEADWRWATGRLLDALA